MTAKKCLNVTNHLVTEDQVEVFRGYGFELVEPDEEVKARIKSLITFTSPPSLEEMESRANALATLLKEGGYSAAMCGGASYFMPLLTRALKAFGIQPIFAFTQRRVEEIPLPDGGVQKKVLFKCEGVITL